jgi:membrane protein
MSASDNSSAPRETFRWAMIFDLLKVTWAEWQEDKVPRLSAAFSYYAVFSIAPLLLLAISIAGTFLGEEAARGEVKRHLAETIGATAAEAIQGMIEGAAKNQGSGLASIVGIGVSLLGASALFGQLQDSLNSIWEVTPKPSGGLLNLVRQRFLSFAMVLGVGFMLLVSLVTSAAIAAAATFAGGWLPLPAGVLQAGSFVVFFLLTAATFAAIYKILPDAQVQWRDVWVGAFLTAFLFSVGRLLLGLYLGRPSVTSAYGAAGSLVVILLWVYYASQILFFGAEFTKTYANRFGSKVRPSPNAVPVTDEARAREGLPRLGDVQATEAAQKIREETGRAIPRSEIWQPGLDARQAQAKANAPATGPSKEPGKRPLPPSKYLPRPWDALKHRLKKAPRRTSRR